MSNAEAVRIEIPVAHDEARLCDALHTLRLGAVEQMHIGPVERR